MEKLKKYFTEGKISIYIALVGLLVSCLFMTKSAEEQAKIYMYFAFIFFIVILLYVAIEFFYKLKKINEQKQKLSIALSRDIKLFFPKDSVLYKKLMEYPIFSVIHHDNGKCFVEKNDLAGKDIYYPSFKDIVTDETESVICRVISKNEKVDKCFVQMGFILTDKNDKTILIERLPEVHSKTLDDKINNPFLKDHSFLISFSPIPDRYGESINILNIFHREVPISGYEPQIHELGFAMCDWEIGNNLPCYCFYIFVAKYKNLDFSDQKILSAIFKNKNGEWFEKDHDSIQEVLTLNELKRRVVNPNNPDEAINLKKLEKYIITGIDIKKLCNCENYLNIEL